MTFAPWLNFFLAIIRRPYGEFEQRATHQKSALVIEVIRQQLGDFRLEGMRVPVPVLGMELRFACGKRRQKKLLAKNVADICSRTGSIETRWNQD